MKAEVVNSDLFLRIENSRELYSLVSKTMRMPETRGTGDLPDKQQDLTCKLYAHGGRELGANVKLSFVDSTKNVDGIDVRLFPNSETNWTKLREVNVDVNYRNYEKLAVHGLIAASYLRDNDIRIRFGSSN